MIPKFETNHITQLSRHFDSLGVLSDVIPDLNFEIMKKMLVTNKPEHENMYWYHKDHLGSSTQITDRNETVIHHMEYMPSGEQFAEQRSTWGTSYKFNGKELDQETGLYYYGARYYTPEIGIWLSVDPMSDKYPSLSPYTYCANNPIIYIDPDGREIRIYYKESRGIGRLFEKSKYMTYTPGMNYSGTNKFVSNAVKSLNYIHNNGADVHGIISQSAASSDVVKVKRGNEDTYNPNTNVIRWSMKGMEVWDNSAGTEVQGRQSGAMGLFHELGHFFRKTFKPDEYKQDNKTPDSQYGDRDERRVIEDYETPAARILGEGTRDNHDGSTLNTVGPTSTQTRREARRQSVEP